MQFTLKKAGEKLFEATLKANYSPDWVSLPPSGETESSSNPRRSNSGNCLKWTYRFNALYRFHRTVLPPHLTAWSVIRQRNREDIV